MKVLLTGGLGYIGSHISFLLGKKAVVIDNLSNSSLNYKKLLPNCKVYIKNISLNNLNQIISKEQITHVIHLAAFKSVSESIKDPLKYYKNNISITINLLEAMKINKVNNLIHSSSATVYGNSHPSPLTETLPLSSINPYGSTKIICENLIKEFIDTNKNMKAIALRYFNPIGSHPNVKLPDKPKGEAENLMPIIIRSALKKKIIKIFGNNYPTRDGTCIRDYMHVVDLAEAHTLALKKISKMKGFLPINLGSGKGYSVLELINQFQKSNKITLNYKFDKRRKGDPAICYSKINLAKQFLGWKPKYSLDQMCADAWKSYNS